MLTVVSAPTNLGLRPPQPGSVPGTAKAPEALREAGLFDRLAAVGACDGGVVIPGRYVNDDTARPRGRVRNEAQLVDHARRLADRIEQVWASGRAPLIIGGDCSILVGAGVACARRGGTGLVHIDGHTDFRHPGNSDECASVAGEDLAAAIGLHWPAISNIDNLSPYFAASSSAHFGHRDTDQYADEARTKLGCALPATALIAQGVECVSEQIHRTAGTGYWLQVDVDVLDPTVMPAVDSPDPGGIDAQQLAQLLAALAPHALGASVTIFDPDLDPDGSHARLLTDVISDGLTTLGTAARF